jgi:hypothetical protein
MTTIYSAAQRLAPSAAFPQNALAGPSNPQSSIKKKLPLPPASVLALAPKRKRNETPEETSADSASPQPPRKSTARRDGPKKKKANRACYHCQKAHLTCDDCKSLLFKSSVPYVDALYSTALSALRQTRHCRQLYRGPS